MGNSLPHDIRLGPVRLIVRDLQRSCDFYQRVIGLRVVHSDGVMASLACGDDTPIIHLEEHPDAAPMSRRCGLYHVALLYPDRPSLAAAIGRIVHHEAPVQGASDHHTHEAIYLADPDGNGLELACDWPREAWPNLDSVDAVRPDPLDVADLMAQRRSDDVATFAEAGICVGHLHLHVADIALAEHFYRDVVGLSRVVGIDSASFLAAGDYHHHLAVNTWKGAGIPPVDPDAVGLASWSVELPDIGALNEFTLRCEHEGVEIASPSPDVRTVTDPFGHRLEIFVRNQS